MDFLDEVAEIVEEAVTSGRISPPSPSTPTATHSSR
jgi:hypothetical protein